MTIYQFPVKKTGKPVATFMMASCVAVILFTSARCGATLLSMKETDLTITRQNGGLVTLRAELAQTDQEHAQGYMGRKKIPDGTGMLFVFERDQMLSFWMKNTPSPLSIAYIDSTGNIREIHNMEPFSLIPVRSAVSLRYALEVPLGWFTKVGIVEGDKISLVF
ncbi:MAG: DUF192 domain-containing protein [Spirochaetaceae bacterium]|jgi:uncharacterized membrane protein (UPF0127 family)|nr:DUF192 domain-containing protein [Spirochaetaceae bacterium]